MRKAVMPTSKGRFVTVLDVVGWRVPVALALVAAYLIAAPGAVNPAAAEEATALGTCTGSGGTLSVRADGGRYFVCGTGFDNASASCGTLTQEFGNFIYRFEPGSCLGPATFSWESEGTPHVQNMNIEANGNEPPECDPIEPGTTVAAFGIEAVLSISCLDADFDGSGQDELQSSTTDPAHGSVEQFGLPAGASTGTIFYKYNIDFEETLLLRRCDDSFSITIGDDYSPNPKSRPPINISLDFSGDRPPGNCPGPSNEATGQRAAALKKCKMKFPGKAKAKKRNKCIKKAKRRSDTVATPIRSRGI
jgi:hypothetical protein